MKICNFMKEKWGFKGLINGWSGTLNLIRISFNFSLKFMKDE